MKQLKNEAGITNHKKEPTLVEGFLTDTLNTPESPTQRLEADAVILTAAMHLYEETGRFIIPTPQGFKQDQQNQQASLNKDASIVKVPRDYGQKWPEVQLTALGFKFKDNGDKLMLDVVTSPNGWYAESCSDNYYWTYWYDEQKRLRASIFYKSAFYDNNASWSLTRRISVYHKYGNSTKGEDTIQFFVVAAIAKNKSIALFNTKVIPYTRTEKYDWNLYTEGKQQAENWMEKEYSKHADVFAYWDLKLEGAEIDAN